MKLLLLYFFIFEGCRKINGQVQEVDCPDNWVNGQHLGCFTFLPEQANLTWFEAQNICEQLDGYLAEPKTLGQMNFLSGLASLEESFTGIQNWWIGLGDFSHEGVWAWIHSLEVATDSFWREGRPSNRSNNVLDCAVINHMAGGLGWLDDDCLTVKGHGGVIAPVCQRGEVGSSTTQPASTSTVPPATSTVTEP